MRKLSKLQMFIALIVALSFTLTVGAQDDEIDDDYFVDVDTYTYADPDPNDVIDMTSDATIEAITDSSADYYGALVTFEGTLSNFVGTRIFEVMEDELLTDSIVLVVNNSSNAFPSELVEGTLVRVTGRVHPSYDEFNEGDTYVYAPFDENAPTSETAHMNMISFVHNGFVPEEFGEHTLVEVLNVENVEIIGYDDLLTID